MEKKITAVKDGDREIEVTLSYDEVKDDINKAFREERKKIALDGFRKGKVPVPIIKKFYGDAIEYKASEDIAQKKFWDIIKEDDIHPVAAPRLVDVKYSTEEGVYFKILYEVIPEIELKDYTGQTIEKPVFSVEESEIEKEIDELLKTKAEYEPADAVTDKNHVIKVDLVKIEENGEPASGAKTEGLKISLSDSNVSPEIVKNALNKKTGDSFEFSFVDEHKHGDEVHKTEFKYKAEILEIEKIILPEETEDIMLELSQGNAKTRDEFKAYIRKSYEDYFNRQSENIYMNNLLETVVSNNKITPSINFTGAEYELVLDIEREYAAREKKPFDEQSEKPELMKRAEWNAKWKIFKDNLIRIEKFEVTDDELKKEAEKEAEKTGISVDKLMNYYASSGKKETLLEDKIIDYLKSNNIVKEVDPKKEAEKKNKKESKAKKTSKKKDEK